MRIVLVVLDGLADRQHPELGGLTPLEAADTPNLDAMAAEGVSGFHYPIAPGLGPSSFQAHFALFGYPLERFPGRGFLEAVGEGAVPAPGEVVARANFVSVREDAGRYVVTDRPDPREGDDAFTGVDLDARIGDVDVRFVYTGARQGLVFLSSAFSLSHEVSDADPFEAGRPVLEVLPLDEALDPEGAARTADALNAWMRATPSRLAGRPANFVTVKWAGADARVQPFVARYGLRGATVASGVLYGGLAHAVGLDHVDPGSIDGRPREDLERRFETAFSLLDAGYDFVHVHTKVPDSAGHRKDPRRKADRIAALDEAFGSIVAERRWGDDLVIAVTGDHATPSSGPLYHSGEGVPLLVVGGAAGRDDVSTFGELASRRGLLGQLRGTDVMPVLLNAAERSLFLAERFSADVRLGVTPFEDLRPLRATDDSSTDTSGGKLREDA